MQSPHIFKGKEEWNLKALATFKICWCFLSTKCNCWEVSTQDNWCKMPFDLKKILHNEFWAIITSEAFYFGIKLSFNHDRKLFNKNLCFWIRFKQINSSTLRVIIHNGKKALVTLNSGKWKGSLKITMHKIKNTMRDMSTDRKRQSLLFRKMTNVTTCYLISW